MVYSGQTKLIESLKTTNSRTVLIYGPQHFGKKTLVRRFYAEQNLPVYEVTGNAADFRESINLMLTQTNPTVYLIPDVDTLNTTVQNMLLKVLEEPPMKARFVLTANNSILPTIKSRCVTYLTEPYTTSEITAVSADYEKCLEYADSPGRCELIRQAVDFDHIEPEGALRSLMTYIASTATTLDSLAQVLVKANEIGKLLKDRNIPYFTFWLLARKIYAPSYSLCVLLEHLDCLDRYIMIDFYMSYWRENLVTDDY